MSKSSTDPSQSVPTEDLLDQIVDLQARVSFQEDALASLDGVIQRQDQEILILRKQMAALVERMADLQFAGEEKAPGSERPPHY